MQLQIQKPFMRIIIFGLMFINPFLLFAQNGVGIHEYRIDTLEYRFQVEGFYYEKSLIPKLKAKSELPAVKKINEDLRKHFPITEEDSATFVAKQLKEIGAKSLDELVDDWDYPEEYHQDFEVKFLSEELLSVSRHRSWGIRSYEYEGFNYNMRTGERLFIDDFITIQKEELISKIKEFGYELDENDDEPKLSHFSSGTVEFPLDTDGNDEITEHINSLYKQSADSESCTEFYLTKVNGETHVRFYFQCMGPHIFTYGIPLQAIKEFVVFPEFKNELKTWGKNVYALIGKDEPRIRSIVLDDYEIKDGGGYLIDTEPAAAGQSKFCISYWSSDNSVFRLLTKLENNRFVIMDVLEIEKKSLKKNWKITDEFCRTDVPGKEIIAIVGDIEESEQYTKIVKAWRANTRTGKFEPYPREKVKYCLNIGYGVLELEEYYRKD